MGSGSTIGCQTLLTGAEHRKGADVDRDPTKKGGMRRPREARRPTTPPSSASLRERQETVSARLRDSITDDVELKRTTT